MKAMKYGGKAGAERFFWIPCMAMALLLTSFQKNSTEPRNDDTFTVVLDAGHGGHDPGNLGNGYYEKNIALNIVLKAGELLEKHPDVKVIYTRKDDTFVDLYVRGEIANKAGADLFVSVHCDSHTSNAHGAGTFVLGLHANKQNFEIAKKENSVIYLEDDYKSRYSDYDINSPESVIGLTIMQEEFLDQSIALGKDIQDKFNAINRKDRQVKQAGFIVLHQTFMPSVLVETGFLTNKDEGAYLNSKKGQEQMGTAIAEAILTYKKDALANIAVANPNAITKAPDPNAARDDSASEYGTDNGSDNALAVASEQSENRKKGKDRRRAEREKEREAERQEVRQTESAEVNERDAGTASPKETAQIIEEAKAKSKSQSGPATSSADEKPGEVVVATPPVPNKTKETGTPAPKNKQQGVEIPQIIYKVQIMASAKDIPLRPESFHGLNRVAKEPIKNLYRYVYGSTSSLREAKMLKSNADLKGYPSSFIVVYRNGERITFKESKKFISQQ